MNILEPADYAPIPVPIQVPRSASPPMPMFRANRAAWVRAPLEPIAEESLGSWASQEGDPQRHEYISMDQFQGHFRDVNSPAMADPEQVSVLYYPFFRSIFEISNIKNPFIRPFQAGPL